MFSPNGGFKEGFKGGLLMISGQAGIGKTTLTEEFRRTAQARGFRTLWASFAEQADCAPYSAWLTICRQLIDQNGSEPEMQLLQQMSSTSHPIDANRESGSRLRIFNRLLETLAAAASEKPVALFFDDIQHADLASMHILEMLALELTSLELLLVVTMRDGDPHGGTARPQAISRLGAMSHASRLVLRGMDELECAHLCQELTGWLPDPPLARRLHRQTEGNPLFLRQIIQSLVERGHISDGKADLPARLIVPEGIGEAIGLQLGKLSSPCREMLARAAVLGRNFDFSVLCALHAPIDPRLIDEATALGIIRPLDPALGSWQFCHALIRETVYDAIPPMQRLRAHADAAVAIERCFGSDDPQVLAGLAYHSFEGQLFIGSARAIDLARKAGRHASSVGAYEDAVVHLRLALECFAVPGVSAQADRMAVALELANAQRAAGDNLGSIQTCRDAMGWARADGDWAAYAQAALLYEAARWRPGLPSHEAIECLELALDHSDAIDNADVTRIYYSLARAYEWAERPEKAEYHAQTAIVLARDIGDKPLLCDTIDQATSALHCVPGSLPPRLLLHEESVAIARALGDTRRLATAIVDFGVCLAIAGDFHRFRAFRDELAGAARELGEPHFTYVLNQWDTLLATLDGDFAGAASSASAALLTARRISGGDARGINGIQMFLIHREKGTLDRFTELAERIGRDKGAGLWLPGYALLLAESGRHDEARGILDEIDREGIDAIPFDDLRMMTLGYLAEAAAITGHSFMAKRIHDRLVDDADLTIICGPASICFGPVNRVLARLLALMQNHGLARERFERALTQARDWQSEPMILRIACDYCETLLAEGTPASIRRARELDSELGGKAAPLGMRRLAERFSAIGTGLRDRAGKHGFDELTAREVEVLRELAAGASNAEISAGLGISMATVATHVRNILAKTDSRNRTAAAAFARRAGLVANDQHA